MNMNPTDCTKPTRCLVLDRHAEQKINAQGKEVKIVCSKKIQPSRSRSAFFQYYISRSKIQEKQSFKTSHQFFPYPIRAR